MKTQSEIVEFVHDRGLVSVLGGNELPGLISAILGRGWSPSDKGFAGWNDWWDLKIDGQQLPRLLGELERRDDILASRIFRHSKTLVASGLWPVFAPILSDQRYVIAGKKKLSSLESSLLKTVESEDSIRTDRLRKQVKLDGKENSYKFHKALTRLESLGLIVGAEDPEPETHLHVNIWQTWTQRTGSKAGRDLSYEDALVELLMRTVDACVIIKEEEIGSMYEWGDDLSAVVETLANDGSVVRDESNLVSSKVLK